MSKSIALRTTPDPPKSGENNFEVAVKDASGKPIDDAEVLVQFFMAAMPKSASNYLFHTFTASLGMPSAGITTETFPEEDAVVPAFAAPMLW